MKFHEAIQIAYESYLQNKFVRLRRENWNFYLSFSPYDSELKYCAFFRGLPNSYLITTDDFMHDWYVEGE